MTAGFNRIQLSYKIEKKKKELVSLVLATAFYTFYDMGSTLHS